MNSIENNITALVALFLVLSIVVAYDIYSTKKKLDAINSRPLYKIELNYDNINDLYEARDKINQRLDKIDPPPFEIKVGEVYKIKVRDKIEWGRITEINGGELYYHLEFEGKLNTYVCSSTDIVSDVKNIKNPRYKK